MTLIPFPSSVKVSLYSLPLFSMQETLLVASLALEAKLASTDFGFSMQQFRCLRCLNCNKIH
jgi:hypothetical protein